MKISFIFIVFLVLVSVYTINLPQAIPADLKGVSALRFGPDGNLYISTARLFADNASDRVLRYDGDTGQFINVFAEVPTPTGLAFGPDNNLYVTSWTDHFTPTHPLIQGEVLRYDGTTGAFIDVFATDSEMAMSLDLTFGPDGNLYVVGVASPTVRFEGTTGAFTDYWAGGAGLDFGPDANFYLSDNSNILRYRGDTGHFIDKFARVSDIGLGFPEQVAFGPHHELYVSAGNVLRYDGITGDFLEVFVPGDGAFTFGPDENFYIAAFGGVHRYDGVTGQFIDVFIVPEPSMSVLLGFASLLLATRFWRTVRYGKLARW